MNHCTTLMAGFPFFTSENFTLAPCISLSTSDRWGRSKIKSKDLVRIRWLKTNVTKQIIILQLKQKRE